MRVSQTKAAFMVSGRFLIGIGSLAAIVWGLGGRRSAANERHETGWAGGAAGVASDRPLSSAFREKVDSFYRAAKANQVPFPNNVLYPLAIELPLNAYLRHRGVSDDWNQTHIRHDLRKAVTCADGAGFCQTPGALADVASNQSSFYERRALPWRAPEIMAPEDVPQACVTVRALQRGIDRLIDRETAKYSWMARPRREDGHG